MTGYAGQIYGVVLKLFVLLPTLRAKTAKRGLPRKLDVTRVSDVGCGGSMASEMPGISLAGASGRLGVQGVWLGIDD